MSEYVSEKNGGPAFPNHAVYDDGEPVTGMTLRDYVAVRALQVFLANDDTSWEEDVRDALAVADRYLTERNR